MFIYRKTIWEFYQNVTVQIQRQRKIGALVAPRTPVLPSWKKRQQANHTPSKPCDNQHKKEYFAVTNRIPFHKLPLFVLLFILLAVYYWHIPPAWANTEHFGVDLTTMPWFGLRHHGFKRFPRHVEISYYVRTMRKPHKSNPPKMPFSAK